MPDADILPGIGEIRFESQHGFRKRLFAVETVAGNPGKTVVSESPGSAVARYPLRKGRPGIWDLRLDASTLRRDPMDGPAHDAAGQERHVGDLRAAPAGPAPTRSLTTGTSGSTKSRSGPA